MTSLQPKRDTRPDAGSSRLAARLSLVCLLIALATLAAYWPVLRCDFVSFDDNEYVAANPHVLHGLTAQSMGWAFRAVHSGNWHPVTWLSHMLDVTLFGSSAAGPHFTNLLLHVANSLLVFLLCNRLTSALWRSAAVAALFALHPLHVESVAWISERKDVLSGFFFLLTLLAYDAYVKTTCLRATSSIFHLPSSIFYLLSLLLFACGLMSKPMLVTLPFVMLLFDWWPL